MNLLLNNLVHHPRKLFVRRMLFQIHLWVGILLSLYLVLISISGAMLVYHDVLIRSTLPAGLATYDASRVAPLDAVMASAHAAFPGTVVTSINMPYPALPAFLLQVRGNSDATFQAAGDPQTGHVVRMPRSWVDVVYEFHLYLLLGSAHGMQWNGVGAIGLLVLAITGIALWWRGLATWWRALGVSLRHNWRRINYDLHHALGVWTLFVVSAWAISGIYFAWYEPLEKAVNAVSPLVSMNEPEVHRNAGQAKVAGARPNLESFVRTAQQVSPQGALSSITNPSLQAGEDVYAFMNLRSAIDFSHSDIIRMDPSNGEILSVRHYGQNRSAGDWILWLMQPLHFGTQWGASVRAIWCLLGISLAVLTITGLVMYWNRYLRFRWRALRGA